MAGVTPSPRPARPHGKFGLIICFEVIEHTVSPAACVNDVAAFLVLGGCLVFSQPLQPADIEVLYGSWWNIGRRNGHCSFFTADARARLAANSGPGFHRGDWLHSIAPADATKTWPIPPCVHSV